MSHEPGVCEVPDCPTPAASGMLICAGHAEYPQQPLTVAEAAGYLRGRVAEFDHYWRDPDRADGLLLHGTYDISALRLVLAAGPA